MLSAASPAFRRIAQRIGWISSVRLRVVDAWPTRRAPTPSWAGDPRSTSAVIAASAAAVASGPGS